jgi:hypothetical protein
VRLPVECSLHRRGRQQGDADDRECDPGRAPRDEEGADRTEHPDREDDDCGSGAEVLTETGARDRRRD